MIPVEEALSRILADIAPTGSETVSLKEAAGRVLAADVAARRTQPPVALSAMDGYALRSADAAGVGARLRVIGESRAAAPSRAPSGPVRPCASSPARPSPMARTRC